MPELSSLGIDGHQPSFARLCMENQQYQNYFFPKTYHAGECIHSRGAGISHFGIVLSGILKSVRCSREGNEICNAYFEAEDSFPEFLYLTGKRCYTYSLYVEKKASVLWIPIHVFEQMLSSDPRLTSALLLYLSQRGLKNQLYLNCLNYQTFRERIAYWILEILNIQPGQTIRMPCSQKIFANLLHLNRSSLNQELKQMEREGYFRRENGMMLDIDVERLDLLL